MNGNVEVITPELAQKYVDERHPNTRSPVYGEVQLKYAELMENDKWESLYAHAVMFDEDNRLIDGVQRMVAIILCGRHVEMMVLRGVPKLAPYPKTP